METEDKPKFEDSFEQLLFEIISGDLEVVLEMLKLQPIDWEQN